VTIIDAWIAMLDPRITDMEFGSSGVIVGFIKKKFCITYTLVNG